MQEGGSASGQPLAFGVTLEKLSAHTVDEDGEPTFAKHNPMELLRKVVIVSHPCACKPSRLTCFCPSVCLPIAQLLVLETRETCSKASVALQSNYDDGDHKEVA